MELRTDELTLSFEDDGDPGAPPVLVPHGITQSRATWTWLVPHLGDLVHEDALDAMAEALLQLDATVLDPVLDGTLQPMFDPRRELPVPGILLAADSAMPDAVARTSELALVTEHSPQVDCRAVTGSGHLIHDSKQHRQTVLDAIHELLARLPA